MKRKDINELHTELGHPLGEITWAMVKATSLQLTDTFNTCEDCSQGKVNEAETTKIAVAHSAVKGEMLLTDIISPFTAHTGSTKHWLLIVGGSIEYAWSYFLKEKLSQKM